MSKFWRIALAWLLAMALPIQGYAAQTMLLCGPANHQSSLLDEHAGHAHDHAGMVDDDASAHSMAQDGMSAQQGDEATSAQTKHAGKCSVCSSCCSVVAIMTSIVSFAVVKPDLPEVATVKFAHDRVMVGGLERPPRFSRA
ncbi:hypothetical protein J7U46_19320 [Pelomonas sp. V22]|uniref:hypothetical protein n=1 Tax=Pelomonas sp. V22 TaxID=2822139 RepID=UPI0024A99C20|nr:hypothetical protein [Pelomonas sp. V22]MDI4635222.1 hypothetical protein [Pelomonas sp. V22]